MNRERAETDLFANGKSVDSDMDAMPLLWAVRETVGLTGRKFRCGMALCRA